MEDKRSFLTSTMAQEKVATWAQTLATPLGLEHLCLVDEYSVVLSPTLTTLLQTYAFCCELQIKM